MDDQAQKVLGDIEALGPSADPHADDAKWLTDFRYQTALLKTFSGAPDPSVVVSHLMLSGEDGEVLAVRLYRPKSGRLPVLLHLHGGGAIAGSVDTHDPALRALAARTGWLVAAPLYRLAPEHRFPAQLDDAWSALTGIAAQADAIDADADRIVVIGDSIGGTLASALAILVVERGGPSLRGLAMLYPNTDLRRDAAYPSRISQDGNVIARKSLERQIDLYLASSEARLDPLASPILSTAMAQLPPTLIVTGGADPLRDEGEAYAAMLEEAGVAVRHVRFDGMIHAFLQMGGRIDATAKLLDVVAEWLEQR